MEAGRIGIGKGVKQAPAAARNRISPFPFPLRGKPGREGSPHAAKNAAPPQEGFAPLCIPRAFFSRGCLTQTGLLMEDATEVACPKLSIRRAGLHRVPVRV